MEGLPEGVTLGWELGCIDGTAVGTAVGMAVGTAVGTGDGASVANKKLFDKSKMKNIQTNSILRGASRLEMEISTMMISKATNGRIVRYFVKT